MATVPTRIDVVGGRIVLGGVLLRDQQDLLVVLHHRFERADRLLAADEQRHDHVREDDDVAQRQDGQQIGAPRRGLDALASSSGRLPRTARCRAVGFGHRLDLLMDSRARIAHIGTARARAGHVARTAKRHIGSGRRTHKT